jgi:hypothetical protein
MIALFSLVIGGLTQSNQFPRTALADRLDVTQECSNELRNELQGAAAILVRRIPVARVKPWKVGSCRGRQARAGSSLHCSKKSLEPWGPDSTFQIPYVKTRREIMNANWSSWTSEFEPPRINSLQSSSRNLINASEGLV